VELFDPGQARRKRAGSRRSDGEIAEEQGSPTKDYITTFRSHDFMLSKSRKAVKASPTGPGVYQCPCSAAAATTQKTRPAVRAAKKEVSW
jgi:hypothetical protein